MCTPFAQPTLAAEWLVRSPGDAAECPNARTLDVKAPREGRLYVSEHKTGTTKPNSGINANSAYFELLGARPAQRNFHHEVEDEGHVARRVRRTHSAEFKTGVALAVLRKNRTMAELCQSCARALCTLRPLWMWPAAG